MTLARRARGLRAPALELLSRGAPLRHAFFGTCVAFVERMYAAIPMTRDVIVVSTEVSLADAWSIMHREGIRHLPVVHDGALVGMLSDRDVLLRSTRDGTKVVVNAGELVGAAMTPAPFVCGLTTSIDEIVTVMTEKKIDALPVVSQNDHLLGLVTSTDLLLLLRGRDAGKRPLPFDFKVHEVKLPDA